MPRSRGRASSTSCLDQQVVSLSTKHAILCWAPSPPYPYLLAYLFSAPCSSSRLPPRFLLSLDYYHFPPPSSLTLTLISGPFVPPSYRIAFALALLPLLSPPPFPFIDIPSLFLPFASPSSFRTGSGKSYLESRVHEKLKEERSERKGGALFVKMFFIHVRIQPCILFHAIYAPQGCAGSGVTREEEEEERRQQRTGTTQGLPAKLCCNSQCVRPDCNPHHDHIMGRHLPS
jgi:hypothetical protein